MAWNVFKGHFLGVVDKLAPVKEIRIKQRTEPWMNADILELITHRDKAFLRFKRSKNESDFAIFKKLRNKALYLVNKAKTIFFKDKLMKNKHGSKSRWKTLKTMGLPSKKTESSKPIGLKINDEVCFDPLKVAEKFNSFFLTTASSLVEKHPNCSGKFGKSYVKDYYQKLGVRKDSFTFFACV